MALWLLRPRHDLPEKANLWHSPWGKVLGFVIRASSEEEARRIAQEHGGEEIEGRWNEPLPAWLDSAYSTCTVLEADGEPGIVMVDDAGDG